MDAFLNLIEHLGAAGLRHFWLPTILWTLVALPVLGALRAWRSAHPLVQYAAHAALLLTLPLGVLLSAGLDVTGTTAAGGSVAALAVALPEVVVSGSLGRTAWTPLHAVGLLTLAALAAAGARGAYLGLRVGGRRSFERARAAGGDAGLHAHVQALRRSMGVGRPVRAVTTPREVVPFTFGWRRPVIVLPASLTEAEEREMALAHELVHVRRHDYALQWLEQVVGTLFVMHPLVFVVRRTVAAYREMSCDAEVLAGTRVQPKRYARLLYQYVLPPAGPCPMAVGMGASVHQFKSRLLAMKRYEDATRTSRSPGRTAALLAAVVFTVGLFGVACSDLIDTGATNQAAGEAAGEAFVVVEHMPQLEGGLTAVAEKIQYPQIAKLAGVEGRVFVQFTVDASGRVVDPEILKGIGSGCDEEALRVVETLRFEPGRQDGKPVRVKMTMPISFRLR